MADHRLLQPRFPSSRAPDETPRPVSLGDLPADLLEVTSRRLQVAAVVWTALWATGLVFNNLVAPLRDLPGEAVIPWGTPGNVVGTAGVIVSLGLLAYARRHGRDPRHMLDVALGYEVLLGLGIGVLNQWQPQVLVGRLSWICILVLVHPMIAPSTPRKTLAASLVTASMDPLGLAIAWARGVPLPAFDLLVWAYLPNYVCAGLAVLPSHIVLWLSRQVRQARELGSYRLGDLIGRGGMGEVWRADHRLLARPAAIKLIRAERLGLGDSGQEQIALRRFRREAEAAASLQCPHTIQLYDFGITADRTFYLVMELLRGIDLESMVQQFGPLAPARVVHLLRQACASLAEAHARGMVHRDIKPANLFLCRVGLEVDFLKVLDFGLVKHDPRVVPEDTRLTAPDTTAGTPAYLPPEMADGAVVDRRADLYALGCVGYWLLTGRTVFEADTPLAMVVKHLQATPVPPSERVGRPLPPSLERIILDCLAKDPGHRPDSAELLAQRLVACDVGGAWTPQQAGTWWTAHLPESGDPVEITTEGPAFGNPAVHQLD